jgi:hypothetical protein
MHSNRTLIEIMLHLHGQFIIGLWLVLRGNNSCGKKTLPKKHCQICVSNQSVYFVYYGTLIKLLERWNYKGVVKIIVHIINWLL